MLTEGPRVGRIIHSVTVIIIGVLYFVSLVADIIKISRDDSCKVFDPCYDINKIPKPPLIMASVITAVIFLATLGAVGSLLGLGYRPCLQSVGRGMGISTLIMFIIFIPNLFLTTLFPMASHGNISQIIFNWVPILIALILIILALSSGVYTLRRIKREIHRELTTCHEYPIYVTPQFPQSHDFKH